ncbi:MAG: hypothetical protein JWN24_64 [Phycisphaerales bacterium]|nr:hypothetical protein [Phycisphaerales bacterium]
MPTFIQGLARVLNCAKVHVAIGGLVTTWFAVRYAAGDLPPTQRASLWVAFIGAVAVQLREIINAWTEEDVARLAAAGPASIATSANASIPETPAGPSPAQSIAPRSPNMPPRTKLPLILIGFSLIALLPGCQTPPELTAYREGLHAVDEPLYQAHLLLLDDAVKANLRTDADRQVIQQGIAAGRGLYEQSKKTQASGTVVGQ